MTIHLVRNRPDRPTTAKLSRGKEGRFRIRGNSGRAREGFVPLTHALSSVSTLFCFRQSADDDVPYVYIHVRTYIGNYDVGESIVTFAR